MIILLMTILSPPCMLLPELSRRSRSERNDKAVHFMAGGLRESFLFGALGQFLHLKLRTVHSLHRK